MSADPPAPAPVPGRVFVTGGTGYVGRAVAEAFRRAGHAVTGMVRGEAAASRLRAAAG